MYNSRTCSSNVPSAKTEVESETDIYVGDAVRGGGRQERGDWEFSRGFSYLVVHAFP
jgi:hypothetical protein